MNIDGYNRVFLVNDGINEFLKLDKKHQLKRVNLGIRAFQRCKNKHNGANVVYRITQEGLQSLFPLFTKRKVKLSIETLMYMATHQNMKLTDIPDNLKDLKEIVTDPELGYFALYVEQDGTIIEMTTLMKFKNSIILMASDEMIGGIKVKYSKEFINEPPVVKTKKPEIMDEDK